METSLNISEKDFDEIINSIDSMTREEDIKRIHQELIGKQCMEGYTKVEDCGVKYIGSFLTRDLGRSIVYKYSDGAQKFITSKYLSDYFKTEMKKLLTDSDIEILTILNSDKDIKDMSEEEIKKIYVTMKQKLESTQNSNSLANYLFSYLYKLPGNGAATFLKNDVGNDTLAKEILIRCGVNPRSSYYVGRGVNRGDLDDQRLAAIFEKLFTIDSFYATNFALLIFYMETLGATEVINSFKNLANNGFMYTPDVIDSNNLSLQDAHGDERNILAFIGALGSTTNRKDLILTLGIKLDFLKHIEPYLKDLDYDFTELINEVKSSNPYMHR